MTELIQLLSHWDAQIFLFFNGMHNGFWDYFMYIYSNPLVWIPLYASFLFVMLRNLPAKVTLATLCVIALVVALSDQTTSGLLKPLVGRLRPSNPDNPLSPLVHVVQGYRGGKYGFPSSHASNTWGLAFIGMYLARRKTLTLFLGLWALLTCYSRMYLGVHYFGDILVGSVIGIIYATLLYSAYRHFLPRYTDRFKPVHPLRYSYVPIAVGIVSVGGILCASGILWWQHQGA